ncbi:replication protein [Desulfosporosinus nitroreducens]|uniref:replication protein n=1 Tax=Desulfosporosinus nitroreducens TaxID=2018668 RepID=UPI00207C94A8|nr:replication protein [Desulfosporosinus nitroreducens]MCO1599850.1 replication protein [Desulfosporosinus nitroreducens]
MADVQIDSGEFTRIANILLEKTAQLHLNGTQYSIILTVWRFTYGFQRREHELSITFIANATGTVGRVIKRELKSLIDRNILLVTKGSTKSESRTLKFNKDFETWIEGTKKSPAEEGTNQSPGDQLVPWQGTKKSPEEGTKKTPNKESKENYKESIYIVFSHWNSKKIITHKSLNDKTYGHINARFEEGFSLEEILTAIDNYKIILSDNELYFWSYKWGLGDFMVRGLDKFKTESDPFSNYKKKDKPPPKGPTDNLGKSQKGKYDGFYL